jgi:hypothetical protein
MRERRRPDWPRPLIPIGRGFFHSCRLHSTLLPPGVPAPRSLLPECRPKTAAADDTVGDQQPLSILEQRLRAIVRPSRCVSGRVRVQVGFRNDRTVIKPRIPRRPVAMRLRQLIMATNKRNEPWDQVQMRHDRLRGDRQRGPAVSRRIGVGGVRRTSVSRNCNPMQAPAAGAHSGPDPNNYLGTSLGAGFTKLNN